MAVKPFQYILKTSFLQKRLVILKSDDIFLKKALGLSTFVTESLMTVMTTQLAEQSA